MHKKIAPCCCCILVSSYVGGMLPFPLSIPTVQDTGGSLFTKPLPPEESQVSAPIPFSPSLSASTIQGMEMRHVYVGHIPYTTGQESTLSAIKLELTRVFGEKVIVVDLRMPTDRVGRHKGFAFLDFLSSGITIGNIIGALIDSNIIPGAYYDIQDNSAPKRPYELEIGEEESPRRRGERIERLSPLRRPEFEDRVAVPPLPLGERLRREEADPPSRESYRGRLEAVQESIRLLLQEHD